jgi:hypothetical protein
MVVPPSTVQDAAPEVGHPHPLNPHVASRLLRGGRRKTTASTTNPKAAPHLVIYAQRPPLGRQIIISFASAVVLAASASLEGK